MFLLNGCSPDNDTGSLVNAATTAPIRRMLTPRWAAASAYLLLWGWQKFNRLRPQAPTDYMEACKRMDNSTSAPAPVKSLASLLVVASGSAIGREGAMILLAALAASSFVNALHPALNGNYGLLGAAAGMAGAYLPHWRAVYLLLKSCLAR